MSVITGATVSIKICRAGTRHGVQASIITPVKNVTYQWIIPVTINAIFRTFEDTI